MKIEIRDITIERIIKLRSCKDITPAEYEDYKDVITSWVNNILHWGVCELLIAWEDNKKIRGINK